MRRILSLAMGVFLLLQAVPLTAQRAAVGTNLLGLATANLNLELSHMVAPRWSVHLALEAKPWSYPLPAPVGFLRCIEGLDKGTQHLAEFGTIKHTEHYSIQPSLRYWTRGVYNRGLFFSLSGVATLFKYGGDKFESNYREGWTAGVGASLGYSFELSKRWNLEAELGIAGLFRSYQMVDGETNVKSEVKKQDFVPSFSRLGVSLVYIL